MQEEKLEKVREPDVPANENPSADKSLEELLAEAQAKIEQQRDAMLRAVAEAENVRKRVQAEAAAGQKYALERFAEGLLPVVDSLEAALRSGDISGVELTLPYYWNIAPNRDATLYPTLMSKRGVDLAGEFR